MHVCTCVSGFVEVKTMRCKTLMGRGVPLHPWLRDWLWEVTGHELLWDVEFDSAASYLWFKLMLELNWNIFQLFEGESERDHLAVSLGNFPHSAGRKPGIPKLQCCKHFKNIEIICSTASESRKWNEICKQTETPFPIKWTINSPLFLATNPLSRLHRFHFTEKTPSFSSRVTHSHNNLLWSAFLCDREIISAQTISSVQLYYNYVRNIYVECTYECELLRTSHTQKHAYLSLSQIETQYNGNSENHIKLFYQWSK